MDNVSEVLDYNSIDIENLSLEDLTTDFTFPIKYNENELLIKTPIMYFRREEDNSFFFEFSIDNDDFFSKIREIEEYIYKLVLKSGIADFNENYLKDLFKSNLRVPTSVKMAPYLKCDANNEVIVIDKTGKQLNIDTLKKSCDVNTVIKIESVSFKKTSWCIKTVLQAVKIFDSKDPLEKYVFTDNDNDTDNTDQYSTTTSELDQDNIL